jgi:hypothetical protein
MSVTAATKTMLERLGFSDSVAAYLMRDCGIDSLQKVTYLDGEDDVENTINDVTSPGGAAVTSHNNGIPVPISAVANLNICVYYLKHMERVQCKHVVTDIDLELVRGYDRQIYEATYVGSILALFISSRSCEPRMEGMLTCCCLTISLGQTIWATWLALLKPS